MRAFVFEGFGVPPAVRDDLPVPTPGPNEVLVRVHASSVNAVDGGIAAGMLKGAVEHRFPVTLGRDFAGAVEAVGDQVSSLAPGNDVFGFVRGMTPVIHEGTWAEFIVAPEAQVARIPDGIEVSAAGALGLAAATALAGVDALELAPGDDLLIVGATGGVGSFAAQLAAARGANVIAPGRPEDEEYLSEMGVREVVPRDDDVVAAVRALHPDGVDALLDVVSFAPGTYDEALKGGARVASPLNAAGKGPGRSNVDGVPTPEILRQLAQLLDAGTLVMPIQQTFELEQAGEALQAFGATHRQGKLGLTIA